MNGLTLRFRLGVFVLTSILLFAILAFVFGASPTFLNIFNPADRFFVEFEEAPGVGPGTPVRRAGVRIGEVRSLKLEDEDVLVEIAIERPNHIRHDERATLGRSLLGGDTTIDFIREPSGAKEPDKSLVASGEKLKGRVPPSMRTVLTQATNIVEPTTKVLEQISKSLEEFDKMMPDLRDAVREVRGLAKTTQTAVADLRPGSNVGQVQLLIDTTAAQALAPAGSPLGSLAQTAVATKVAESNAYTVPNRDIQELVKALRDTAPELRRTTEEIGTAARNWGRVGERVNVLLEGNQDKLIKALDNLNDVLSRVGLVFSEENQRNLAATLKNVRAGSDNLESITKNTDEIIKESRKTIARVNDVVGSADETMRNLNRATGPMAERSGNIMKNLDESTAKLNKTLSDVQDLLRGLGTGDGTLRRFINDPALYNHLDEAACMLVKAMPRIERILRDAETFADKLARHPESIGVRGAITPSSGLKEAPTAPMPRKP